MTSTVDTEGGQITLPLDRFMLTAREQADVASAQYLAFATCVAAAGVPIEFDDIGEGREAEASRIYGVWFRPEAERYGYGLPSMSAAGAVESDAAGVEPTDAEIAVYESCNSDHDVVRFESGAISPGFDYAEETTGLSDRVFATDEVKAVLAEWEGCLSGVGLTRDTTSSPWQIAGTSIEPTEANIRTALLDVDCKEQVDYVQRIADVEADMQAPIVREHLAELQQMRAEYDAMVEDARTYLAENTSG